MGWIKKLRKKAYGHEGPFWWVDYWQSVACAFCGCLFLLKFFSELSLDKPCAVYLLCAAIISLIGLYCFIFPE
jgi:hypothetical protein